MNRLNTNAAKGYLHEIVEPTIADFERNPTFRRYAFLAAVATYHTLDYMYESKGGRSNKRKEFRDACPAFALVDRVAHAYKHTKSGDENDPNNLPLTANAVVSRPPGVWDKFEWDNFRWDDQTGGVTLSDNKQVDLLETLKEAERFLRSKLNGETAMSK